MGRGDVRYLFLAISGPLAAIVIAGTLRACLWILDGTPTKDFTDVGLFVSCALGAVVFYLVGHVIIALEKGEG